MDGRASESIEVFVVYDLGGAGRVVGVFRDGARAQRIVAINPAYYRLTRCKLDEVSPAAFEWLKWPNQRDELTKISGNG